MSGFTTRINNTCSRCYQDVDMIFEIDGVMVCNSCISSLRKMICNDIITFKINNKDDRDIMASILLKNGYKVSYQNYTEQDIIRVDYYIHIEDGDYSDD